MQASGVLDIPSHNTITTTLHTRHASYITKMSSVQKKVVKNEVKVKNRMSTKAPKQKSISCFWRKGGDLLKKSIFYQKVDWLDFRAKEISG